MTTQDISQCNEESIEFILIIDSDFGRIDP